VRSADHTTSGVWHDGVSDRQVGDPVSVRVAVPASRAVTVHERLELPSLNPGGTLTFPKEFGRQAHNPFVVQQNLPDGSSPIVFPSAVATGVGVAPNPRCQP